VIFMKVRPFLTSRSDCTRRGCSGRRGTATVELAIIAPVAAFLFVVAVDFSRIFYYSTTLDNCARNGALYGSKASNSQMPYSSIEQATIADGGSLSPAMTTDNVHVSYTYDAQLNPTTITVQVTYPFTTMFTYPGVPSMVNLIRQVEMPIAP
jgi:Flp pilus assembly protein TadG